MIKTLLGEVREGRLRRLPYLGYSLLLLALCFVLVVAVVMAIGAGEHLMGGDLEQARDQLGAWMSVPLLVVFSAVAAALVFSGLNIMAKRIRDAGLPGWWGVFAVTLASAIVSGVVSQEAGSALHSLVWIALLLIPGDSFGREARLGA